MRDSLLQLKFITYPDGSSISINETGDTSGGVTATAVQSNFGILDLPRHVTRFEYNAHGLPTKVTQEVDASTADRVVEATYDDFGNRLTLIDTAAGLMGSYTDSEGHQDLFAYNLDGQVESYTDGEGRVTGYEVFYGGTLANPEPGKLEKAIFPTFTRTTLYDERDRPIRQTDNAPDAPNQVTTWAYDGVGNVIEEVLPGSRLISREYDVHNRLTKETYGDGFTEFQRGDAWGTTLTVVDPELKETLYAYNKNGQLSEETRSVTQKASYLYDGNGNLEYYLGRNGQKIKYSYDVANRLETVETYNAYDVGDVHRAHECSSIGMHWGNQHAILKATVGAPQHPVPGAILRRRVRAALQPTSVLRPGVGAVFECGSDWAGGRGECLWVCEFGSSELA